VLSKYHRSLYPNKPDEKFMLSANGIVPEQFNIDVPRNPKKCVYASAPDRGLHCLLQMWPKIREQVPDAELYWAYGWNTFDLAAASNPQLQVLKNEIQMMLRQPGVTELGRIGHEEVAKLMMSSALWLYPTMFTEVYCITAIKAQAAGAMPITTNVAALEETVQDGIKFDVKDIYYNEEAQAKFIAATVKALQNPPDHEAIKAKATGRWSWSSVAKQWDNEFSR
jgi:glycosyltransferase involved in cell wall biosynthesis